MKALIAAGGSGTRLRPLTFSSNKHMLPIANKPLILYPIESVAATGVKNVAVVVNETRAAIEGLLGDGSKWGLNITYIDQHKPLGLAHVVKIAKEYMAGSSFVYHLGDNIFTKGIKRPFDAFVKKQPNGGLLTMVEHPENYRLGVPYFDRDGKLLKVVEKPKDPPNKFGVPGLYFFNANVFKAFEGKDALKPSARGELEIPDLYTYLLDHGYTVEVEEVGGRWMDPGKFDDMLEANAYMLSLSSDLYVHERVLIDDESIVKGEVGIGQGSKLVRSKIRGPVSIGNNVVITDCIIGPNVSIEADCRLTGLELNNSVVMSESTLSNLDGVVINSMVGKKTVVEGRQESKTLFIGDHCTVWI